MSPQGIHTKSLSPTVRKYMCTIPFVPVLFAICKHWKQVRGPYREGDLINSGTPIHSTV